ncbi:MAG: hypothetical protein ACI9ZD_000160 [Paracoccaceae bacterium]|jgi:hypothetical protein
MKITLLGVLVAGGAEAVHQYMTDSLFFKYPAGPLGAITGRALVGALVGAFLGSVWNGFAKKDDTADEDD